MTFDDIPLTILEQEIFCECGAWKNFLDLEESLSLDELIVLYEATLDRNQRLVTVLAAAAGADMGDQQSPVQFVYSDSKEVEKDRKYINPALYDPQKGGELEPVYGEDELARLPINLGYSIIEGE